MKLHELFPQISLNPSSAKDIKQWILQLAVEGKLTKKWRTENNLTKDVWKEKKLSEIAEINGGYAFKSQQYTEYGVRIIRISDFDEQGMKNEKIVRHPYNSTFEAYRLKPLNIIMAMTGGTVGKALLVKEVNEEMFVNQRVANIKVNNTHLPNFVFSVLKTKDVQKVIENAKNSTNDNISMNDIKNFIVPTPPIQEQQAIVTIVEDLFKEADELVQQATQRIELKRSYAQSALKRLCEADTTAEWKQLVSVFPEIFNDKQTIKTLRETILQLAVQGKLTAKWRGKSPSLSPASELLEQIKAEKAQLIKEKKIKAEKPLPKIEVDEIPFELPVGWVWCRLGEICETITKGSSPKWQGVDYVEEGNGILFITSENVGNYNLILNNKKYVERKFNEIEPRSILKKNDLLMNIVGGSIGRTAKYDLDELANINQAVTIIRLINQRCLDYYLHFFNSTICLEYMFDKQVDNARPNLSMGNIAKFIIPIPSIKEQHIIVEKVNAMMSLCDELEMEVEGLNQLKLKL